MRSLALASLTILAALAAAAAPARAGAPSLDAVRAALPTWTSNLAAPFSYQGLANMATPGRSTDELIACDKLKSHGVAKDAKKVAALVACFPFNGAATALAGKPELGPFDPAHAPPEMLGTLAALQDEGAIDKGYPEKLAKLARGKTLVMAHTTNPAVDNDHPWEEQWTVWIARDDHGAVKFDGVLVVQFVPSAD